MTREPFKPSKFIFICSSYTGTQRKNQKEDIKTTKIRIIIIMIMIINVRVALKMILGPMKSE